MVEWLFSIRDINGERCRVYAETAEDALELVRANPEEYGDEIGEIELKAIRVEEGGKPLQKLES